MIGRRSFPFGFGPIFMRQQPTGMHHNNAPHFGVCQSISCLFTITNSWDPQKPNTGSEDDAITSCRDPFEIFIHASFEEWWNRGIMEVKNLWIVEIKIIGDPPWNPSDEAVALGVAWKQGACCNENTIVGTPPKESKRCMQHQVGVPMGPQYPLGYCTCFLKKSQPTQEFWPQLDWIHQNETFFQLNKHPHNSECPKTPRWLHGPDKGFFWYLKIQGEETILF